MRRGKIFAFALIFFLSALFRLDRATARASSTLPTRGLGATAPNPVEPIVKRMRAAQTRLKEGDTGPDTRGIQEQVVHDLDKLIDAASRQSESSRSSRKSPSAGKSPQEGENGSPQSSQAAPRSGADGASATTGGAAPGKHGGTRTPRAVQAKVTITGHGSLLREVWGHLPPAMRERVRVDFSETVLPAYDELVRRYFEALLEEPPQRKGGAPGPANPTPLSK
ncbi:MAG TPA: hypothetical protein VGP76_21645 [Planctomycetaceae bacterium]|jgi:hypothetical protein|nr:hypothetical protein [Planctomycetaceae bacterium]